MKIVKETKSGLCELDVLVRCVPEAIKLLPSMSSYEFQEQRKGDISCTHIKIEKRKEKYITRNLK